MNKRKRAAFRSMYGSNVPKFIYKYPYDIFEPLAKIILASLIEFKKANRNSHPIDLTFDQWHEYLDKMIWSFTEIINNHKNSPYTKWLFNQSIYSSEEANKRYQKYDAKFKEGMHLFAEYFEHLWD